MIARTLIKCESCISYSGCGLREKFHNRIMGMAIDTGELLTEDLEQCVKSLTIDCKYFRNWRDE